MKLWIILAFFAILASAANSAVLDVVQEEAKATEEAFIVPEESINEDCHQPRETGRCFALFYRYAFNVENRACEEFIYGGCAGNKNNFQSKEECELKCMTNTQSISETTDASSQVPEAPKAETTPNST